MKFKNVVIEFEDVTLEFDEVEDMAVAMNGFLAFKQGNRHYFYNFEGIRSYSWDQEEDEPTESNLHVIQ